MLSRLSIRNYAIIDELDIDFPAQLNIITGETGAGKSIIMGALGLILGERADSSSLVNREKKCIVEGTFQMTGKKSIRQFLSANDFDIQDELVVRREIAVNGKSRAFINDTPVTLAQLGELSGLLVDLHQQFDTLTLGQADFQREVIDALAAHQPLLEQYEAVYYSWQSIRRDLKALQEQKVQFDKEADYNRFQYTELEEAAFRDNELEEAETELKLLGSGEAVKSALDKAVYELKDGETPLVQRLKIVLQQLNHFADIHPQLPELVQRLQSAQIELQDIAGEIDSIAGDMNFDPARMELLNERVSLGYRLQKKHGVHSTRELLNIQQQLEEKLKAVLHIDDAITQKQEEEKRRNEEAVSLARRITTHRQKQVRPLEEKVNKLLAQVGMPNAKLQVSISEAPLSETGADKIEFLFDANKSGQFQPVRKVASGGELSRLMLCIKSLVAQSIDMPTLIFDEIDTGISGEAARQVGLIMKELSTKRQVICITHQPQIAGKADAHFFVYKEIMGDVVKTNIRRLSLEERITAIAKMLSGEKPTAAAMENAREMVRN